MTTYLTTSASLKKGGGEGRDGKKETYMSSKKGGPNIIPNESSTDHAHKEDEIRPNTN